MNKSIRLKNDTYFDISSITSDRRLLKDCMMINLNSEIRATDNDLNNAVVGGQYSFNPNTLNSPDKQVGGTDNYGIVLVFTNSNNNNYQYKWTFQIAITTQSRIYIRININHNGWWNWLKVSYQ